MAAAAAPGPSAATHVVAVAAAAPCRVQAFAKAYYRANAAAFSSPDTVEVLAFSIIMLNTDAHNPSIRKQDKMTMDQFVRNNRCVQLCGVCVPRVQRGCGGAVAIVAPYARLTPLLLPVPRAPLQRN